MEIENLSFISPWSINAFKTEVANPISHLWALTADKNLLGYICFWMFDSEIQVINLAIHPQKRGHRFGYLLLAKMIVTGISKGMQNVWLEVRPSNLAAKSLYEKLGFEEVNRRRQYYTDTNEDAIVMALGLTQKEHYYLASN